MKKIFILIISLCSLSISINAQTKVKTKKVKKPVTITTASGLQYTITTKSNGRTPKTGEKIEAHYVGKLLNDTIFDSSRKRGAPISFRLGVGRVIKGWDEAFLLLKQGEQATLKIPADLAYGSRDNGKIPANSVLLFDVELISISEGIKSFQTRGKDSVITESGAKIFIVQTNPSGTLPAKNDQVKINYTGYFMDGKIFDTSYDRGEPMPFSVGKGNVIKGLDEAIQKVRMGEKARIIIPYMLAYGEKGYAGVIPEKADLIFDIDLVDIQSIPYKVEGMEVNTTPSGLKYIVVHKGTGKKAEKNRSCSVHYSGYLEDGSSFDSSLNKGQPFQFNLGMGQVIQGWDEGVQLMSVGDRYRFIIPSNLGYGDGGQGPIPPKATLIFDVELLGVN